MQKYKNVTLAIHIMKVNKIPFFNTISVDIKFGTTEAIQTMKGAQLKGSITQVMRLYRTRGFKVTMVKADNQFEFLRGDLVALQCGLNTVSENEHVPEIERHNQLLKERVRCNYNMTPIDYWPARLLIEAVYSSQFWLNSIPPFGKYCE